MSKLFSGDCPRVYQWRYFWEKIISAPSLEPNVYSTGRQIRSDILFEPSDKLVLMLQTLFFLEVFIDYI